MRDDPPERPAVGERLRRFRQERRLTLSDVAQAAQISASHLSMIERDRSSASIGMLRRITQALGISMAGLFQSDEALAPRPLRREDRPLLASEPGANKYLLSPPPLKAFEVYAGEFEVGASTGDHDYVHGDSQELLIVTSGSVELFLAGVTHRLDAGDSIEFRSSKPHKISNISEDVSTLIWVISPPTE
jgi:transcriptional regulator with XRE-family HTH domain